MEENFVGYILGSLDPETQRNVEAYLAESPVAQHQVELLRRAMGPLAVDRDTIDPPDELALRTISRVAEHIVATEGTVVAQSGSPVSDFIRAIGRPPESRPKLPPVFPAHATEATPPSWSPRNLFVSGGLTVALLMIGFAAVMTVRQTREVKACQNNLRSMHQAISSYCDVNDNQCPQVQPGADVRDVLKQLNDQGHLARSVTFGCPGTGNTHACLEVNGRTFIPSAAAIEYAYCMGYRDELGHLNGLTRGSENEYFPILADAPLRQGEHAVAVNHRKGQNVLFLGGNVRFCTTPNVGPAIEGVGDDIYYNTVHQPRAGTHRWDAVLGRANEQP